jgi:hypothetical protein
MSAQAKTVARLYPDPRIERLSEVMARRLMSPLVNLKSPTERVLYADKRSNNNNGKSIQIPWHAAIATLWVVPQGVGSSRQLLDFCPDKKTAWLNGCR